jgi:hypothetical protein
MKMSIKIIEKNLIEFKINAFSKKVVYFYLCFLLKLKIAKILFARILANTKKGQILFDRILARKKGENHIC